MNGEYWWVTIDDKDSQKWSRCEMKDDIKVEVELADGKTIRVWIPCKVYQSKEKFADYLARQIAKRVRDGRGFAEVGAEQSDR